MDQTVRHFETGKPKFGFRGVRQIIYKNFVFEIYEISVSNRKITLYIVLSTILIFPIIHEVYKRSFNY